MIARIKRSNSVRRTSAYGMGDKKELIQPAKIIGMSGILVSPEDVATINRGWRLDDQRSIDTVIAAVRRVAKSINQQFNDQAMGATTKYITDHIILSFSPVDVDTLTEIAREQHLTDEALLRQITQDYLAEMELTERQYLISMHLDARCIHLHIALNRIGSDGRMLSIPFWKRKNVKAAAVITSRYGLARGRETFRECIRIGQILGEALVDSASWEEFIKKMKAKGILTKFRYSGNRRVGVSFCDTKRNGHIYYPASRIHPKFNYKSINKYITEFKQLSPRAKKSHLAKWKK